MFSKNYLRSVPITIADCRLPIANYITISDCLLILPEIG